MKKISKLLIVMLALTMVLSACGGGEPEVSTPAPAVESETPSTDAPVTAAPEVSDDNPVVSVGEVPAVELPVIISSVGQSADASMLNAMMGKLEGVEFTFDSLITSEGLGDAKTLIIASGASSKGLGAAGISEEDERARATALLETANANGVTVILAHIGGAERRGPLSDGFITQVMESSDYILVVQAGDEDAFFTNYATTNSLPITYLNKLTDTQAALENLFVK